MEHDRKDNSMKWHGDYKWTVIGFVFLLLTFLLVGTFIGKEWERQTAKPQVIEKYYHTTDNITTEKVQAIYIDRPIEVDKVVYIDKPIPVPQTLNRCFTSLAELKQWLRNDATDWEFEYTGTGEYAIDCDNFAYTLQANADRDGYLMSVEHDELRNHEFNTTRIGNIVYGIEPQND